MINLPEVWAEHAVWLPAFIFCARICDMSLDTFRMICVVRGMRLMACVAGFFQVMIWLTAVASVLSHMDRFINVVAYAGGFATGTWIGMFLEGKLALGVQIVRMISREINRNLPERLRDAGYRVTELQGHGRDAPVIICFVAALRRDVPELLRRAERIDPGVFVTVEDTRHTNFRSYHQVGRPNWFDSLRNRIQSVNVPPEVEEKASSAVGLTEPTDKTKR